jgi:hypothetical protein
MPDMLQWNSSSSRYVEEERRILLEFRWPGCKKRAYHTSFDKRGTVSALNVPMNRAGRKAFCDKFVQKVNRRDNKKES